MNCDTQSNLLSVEQALTRILNAVPEFKKTEIIELRESLGYVLAQDIVSDIDVPPADNSAMDGYAINTKTLAANDACLTVSQRVPAGSSPEPLMPDSTARIFTGGEIPEGADAVVMQELCVAQGNKITFPLDVRIGQNIRQKGQDILCGSIVLPKGTRLKPQHMGLLASIGLGKIPVFQRLKVALLSTGDELVEPGEICGSGKIYNSNRYTLAGLITALGMELVDLGIVKDTPQATKAALRSAADKADCIITSGGVSVGEEDHVKPAVERLGKLELWNIAVKPGKPLAFGLVQGVPIIGLPGNPVSTLVTFCLFARPFLLSYQQVRDYFPQAVVLKSDFEVKKPSNRTEYLRAQVVVGGSGESLVRIFKNQSSGVLMSACWAHGFAVVPPETTIKRGDRIEFLHYAELLR